MGQGGGRTYNPHDECDEDWSCHDGDLEVQGCDVRSDEKSQSDPPQVIDNSKDFAPE